MPALPLTGRNRAPETAALAKSRTLPTDGAVAKFLMTILQQLDMKSVSICGSSLARLPQLTCQTRLTGRRWRMRWVFQTVTPLECAFHA